MKNSLILFSLLVVLSINSQGQTLLAGFSFDDESLDGWQSTTLTNNGEWRWEADGKADDGSYWDNRDSIHSSSLGGAAVYDASKISGFNNPGFSSSGALASPALDFSSESTIFLRFHQYFRNFNASTTIEFSTDGGMNWNAGNPLVINSTVALNVETGTADYQVFDLSSVAANEADFALRFVFEGNYYFWILDDVEFYDAPPVQQTIPAYVGDTLQAFAYPYEIESSKWPYVTDELVVQFKLGTPPALKQALRDTLAAILVDSCTCGRLELWRMGDNIIVNGDTLSGDGGSIGIQERIKKSKASSGIDGIDYNRYNYNQFENDIPIPNIPLIERPDYLTSTSNGAIRVAVLDTGIDLDHDSLRAYIYRNELESVLANGVDEDDNCLVDDWAGWNYVDNNNNPNDDHSHGTHVAGIIVDNLKTHGVPSCDFKIIPYKTHDYHGFSTLYDVACATYQALEDEASVINDSWGFYGDPSIILQNAIDTAKLFDVLVVSAAGNDTTALNGMPQYPACYNIPNVLTVGSYVTVIGPNGNLDTIISGFSNYDPECVDILAEGENITSAVLNNQFDMKSGTSMAAPAVTAAAVMAYCEGHNDYLEVKQNILVCADKYLIFQNVALDGNVLNYNFPCITPVEEIDQEDNDFLVYPNPFSDQLTISNLQIKEAVTLKIISTLGTTLYEKQIDFWYENEQINFPSLSAGVYWIRIQSGNKHWSYKVIKL